MDKVLFSHKSDERETPRDFFDKINKILKLELDVCATVKNAKCKDWYNEKIDGLKMEWFSRRVWCNPPYSQIKLWAKRCKEHNNVAVLLVPPRTSTKWFHENCVGKNIKIIFLNKRLKFGEAKHCAPFDSMLVLYNVSNFKAKRLSKCLNTTALYKLM